MGAAGNAAGFGAGLVQLPMPPGTPDDLKAAADWWENFQRAWTLLHNLEPCASAGFSSSECGDAVWAGACTMYLSLGVDAAPEFALLGLPFEALCKGEPRLKCCKYEPATQDGCHTAFNDPAPINCEGNWTTPNAESYGPCLPIGDPLGIGCTCCGIAECFTPACDPATLGSPISGAWRTDTFAKKIAGSFKTAARQDPAGATEFVTLSGCTAHRDVMLTLAPFAHPDTLPSPDPGGNFHASDNNPDARYLRGLITLAVRRVLAGIPNGIARWQTISARVWTDAEIEAAVATVGDADAILLRLLGPFGFEVLKGADPRHYKLLAVPLAGEPPDANDSPYLAGCIVGQGPTVAIQLSVLTNCATVQLEVQDPLADNMPLGHYPAAVDWGDGHLEHVFLTSPTQQITHCYAAAGTYTVRAWTVNAAGVVTSSETVAVVGPPDGPVDPGPKTVSSIALDLTAVTFSHTPPRVTVTTSAIDPAGTPYLLNRLYAPAPAPRRLRHRPLRHPGHPVPLPRHPGVVVEALGELDGRQRRLERPGAPRSGEPDELGRFCARGPSHAQRRAVAPGRRDLSGRPPDQPGHRRAHPPGCGRADLGRPALRWDALRRLSADLRSDHAAAVHRERRLQGPGHRSHLEPELPPGDLRAGPGLLRGPDPGRSHRLAPPDRRRAHQRHRRGQGRDFLRLPDLRRLRLDHQQLVRCRPHHAEPGHGRLWSHG